MLRDAFHRASAQLLRVRASLDGAPGLALASSILASIAAADFATGYQVSFLVFYLIPVCVAAWFCGLAPAIAISFLTTITWDLINFAAGLHYTEMWIGIWNSASRFAFYVFVSYLFVQNRRAHTQLERLSDTDGLTGLANRRMFARRLEAEIDRQKRSGRPLSLAFLDVDHFKALNDRHGHEAGDQALRHVAEILHANVHHTGLAARIGGDEFALILPEIDGRNAELLLGNIRQALLDAVRHRGWPITFSIGLAHGIAAIGAEAWLNAADEAMYSVKRQGRNAISGRPIARTPLTAKAAPNL